MPRIEKDFKELDFGKVDFENGRWTWGCGGHPLNSGEWSISYLEDGLIEQRYKMPPCINQMLSHRYKAGERDTRRNICNALGL